MNMNWPEIWYYVVWASIIGYFGLGIAITIGGFFDVIKMFRRLESEHAERSSPGSGFPVANREH
jgi:hypothetical protein